jgi:hypothetical protein
LPNGWKLNGLTCFFPKMKNVFALLFMLFLLNTAAGQSVADSIRQANADVKIALHHILGTWKAENALADQTIRFVQEGSASVVIPEIKPGVDHYHFRVEGDSVRVNGYAAHWPPFYCTLLLENPNQLRMLFYTLQSPSVSSAVYQKVRD